MKRLWVGAGILAAVLILAIGLAVFFPRLHQPVSRQLAQAAELALAGEWAEAEKLAAEAAGQWEKVRLFSAAVADHQPLEEIQRLFAQLRLQQVQGRAGEFAATCLQLARLTADLAQSQSLTWWQFL